MKQIKTIQFTIAVLLCGMPAIAHDFEVDGIYYNITSDEDLTVCVTYQGNSTNSSVYSGDITIPNSVRYNEANYSVTSIGEEAFFGCQDLRGITIPASMTNIGRYAFWYCWYLNRIQVEEGNPIYDSRDNCNAIIETATNKLVLGCRSTIIPSSVTSIGEEAFFGRVQLTRITIPNSVINIGENAFGYCIDLNSIRVEEGNPVYDSRYNCNAIIETATNKLVLGCRSTNIHRTRTAITSIGDGAFYGSSQIKGLFIPSTVTSIGEEAFFGCDQLTSISIPNSVTNIGENAFSGCNLNSIEVEEGNPIYDSRDSCNAIIETATNILITGCQSTIIPNSVTSIGRSAFSNCHELKSITIPNSVTNIGYGAFYGCDELTSITIPYSVTSIGWLAFKNCLKLTEINVETENSIYDSRENCNAIIETATNTLVVGCQSTVIPNSVTNIGNSAFNGCINLTSLIIPNSVTTIEEYAFCLCSGLTSITIPNSVISLGEDVFYGCENLSKIVCYAVRPPVCTKNNTFSGVNTSTCVLQVPAGCRNAYRIAEGWKSFQIIEEGAEDIVKVQSNTSQTLLDVYTLQGTLIKRQIAVEELEHELPTGIYIVNGKKMLVR